MRFYIIKNKYRINSKFCICFFNYFSLVFKYLYVKAAILEPINGATINTQTCFKATPPKNKAGAKLLAGFTDVPVKGIPIICTKAKVKPITTPATEENFSLEVTPSIV